MTSQSLRASALIFFFATAAAVSAIAQEGGNVNSADCHALQESFKKELIRTALEYWSPKLAIYQKMIDGNMSKSDLQELNGLRARLALDLKTMADLQARRRRQQEAERQADARLQPDDEDNATPMSIMDSEVMYGSDTAYAATAEMDSAALARMYDADNASVSARVEENVDMTVDSALAETDRAIDMAAADSDVAAAEGSRQIPDPSTEVTTTDEQPRARYYSDDPDVQASTDLILDMEKIQTSARTLSKRYDARMQELDGTVHDDFINFFLVVAHRISGFGDAKSLQECSGMSSDMSEITGLLDSATVDVARDDISREIVSERENVRIMVMLMGSDLSSIAGMLQMGDVPLSLPKKESAAAAATLEQNTPNPASISTEIAFTLPEPSSATTLALYSADGKLALTQDAGARPAGRQVAKINVGGLAPGTYVYRLTISGSDGERVLSRTMQVVR